VVVDFVTDPGIAADDLMKREHQCDLIIQKVQ
jgi:hypothetical protein